MAKMVRFQVNMPFPDQLAAPALEVKIELALITYFNESIPDPGENWDSRRRYREIDIRLKRLGWVRRELRKEYGGLKSAWNWLRGLPIGKELYERMVAEAEDMIMSMGEEREVDILQEVMKYSGLEGRERWVSRLILGQHGPVLAGSRPVFRKEGQAQKCACPLIFAVFGYPTRAG